MSLKLFLKFDKLITERGLEKNKLSIYESLAISEDIVLSESVPERITEKLNELYSDKSEELIKAIAETFKDDFEDNISEMENDSNEEDDTEVDEAYSKLVESLLTIVTEEDYDEDDTEDVDEGQRPKKLTGAAKVGKEEKSKLMSIVKKDPEIKSLIDKTKKKIILKAKSLGKKNGIKVQKVNFDKIKL